MFPEAERGYYKLRGVIIDSWEAFDKYAEEYDAWYEKYKPVYESELAALKVFLYKNPENLKALEIGIGTGRFAYPFGIKIGLDPSRPMAKLQKGVALKQFSELPNIYLLKVRNLTSS